MALPVYELLIQKWTVLASQTIPELSHHINVALQKLQNYVREARKTRIYALAMIVNPDVKFEWMQQYWEPQDVANARKWILEAMTKFRTAEREAGKKQHPALNDACRSASSIAAHAQASAISRLTSINVNIRRSSASLSTPSGTSTPITSNSPHIIVTEVLTGEDLAAYNAQALAEDQKDAERELERYEREQMTRSMGTRVTDLVRYWEQSETLYPLLFHVAMDVLPAQASAVPCERVFSSSKETSTLRRSRLSPQVMEALQILKFSIRGDRLSFTEDLLACEEDYDISGHLTVRAINELVATGKLDELNELAANARDDLDLDDT